jgi:hypothetical protein
MADYTRNNVTRPVHPPVQARQTSPAGRWGNQLSFEVQESLDLRQFQPEGFTKIWGYFCLKTNMGESTKMIVPLLFVIIRSLPKKANLFNPLQSTSKSWRLEPHHITMGIWRSWPRARLFDAVAASADLGRNCWDLGGTFLLTSQCRSTRYRIRYDNIWCIDIWWYMYITIFI